MTLLTEDEYRAEIRAKEREDKSRERIPYELAVLIALIIGAISFYMQHEL